MQAMQGQEGIASVETSLPNSELQRPSQGCSAIGQKYSNTVKLAFTHEGLKGELRFTVGSTSVSLALPVFLSDSDSFCLFCSCFVRFLCSPGCPTVLGQSL